MRLMLLMRESTRKVMRRDKKGNEKRLKRKERITEKEIIINWKRRMNWKEQ
jgi:hypothetical protein